MFRDGTYRPNLIERLQREQRISSVAANYPQPAQSRSAASSTEFRSMVVVPIASNPNTRWQLQSTTALATTAIVRVDGGRHRWLALNGGSDAVGGVSADHTPLYFY